MSGPPITARDRAVVFLDDFFSTRTEGAWLKAVRAAGSTSGVLQEPVEMNNSESISHCGAKMALVARWWAGWSARP
jgi:hypothetical protein